jgi:hypothetical protein
MSSLLIGHMPIYPTSGHFTANLIGTGTAWTSGTPGAPTFTLAGGTGASIVSQTVVDASHAVLVLAGGTALGLLTITDPSTSTTATIHVKERLRWFPMRHR